MKKAPPVTIRVRIFLGCLSLTVLTILVCTLSYQAQSNISNKAISIYDNSLQSLNYLRSAQTIMLGISRDLAVGDGNNEIFVDQLDSTLDALAVAHERAMSMDGKDLAQGLIGAVSNFRESFAASLQPPDRAKFREVEQTFDKAVGVYASDGFRLRGTVEVMVAEARRQTFIVLFASVALALLITVMLNQAIFPPIRRAVDVATSIAGGRLDNPIDRSGPAETRTLLDALGTMQNSIADKIAFIEQLMAQKALGYKAEIALQHSRFETALNHMTLGLCMFDANGRLLVQNRRFIEMFGRGPISESLQLHASSDSPAAVSDAQEDAGAKTYNCQLKDGRTIAVSEEAMSGGGRVVTYEDITDRQRAETHLSYLARHDALTGLPNRVFFREHLESILSSRVAADQISVLCLDLDRFKIVNDTLGHPIGDALLREAANRLVVSVGAMGNVMRLGGDEFAVICKSVACDDVSALAGLFIDTLCQPFDIAGHHISIGVSIGISKLADVHDTPDTLLKNADLALYSAKGDGGGVYRFFEAEMEARVQFRRQMEIDLRAAVAEQQFEIYYQPILSVAKGHVIAFEALLRWHHPKRGFVSPVEFIPLAEETGLIVGMGLWVLEKACKDAATWPGHISVAVNLSPLQFRSVDLVGDVKSALRASGLDAARLELEITESLMLQNTEATLRILHDLRALGIRISMDDFGTGYSSLSYLRRFPFDKIKIDKSFVHDLVDSSDGLAIVKAVVQVGRSLQMDVLAEGVETYEQAQLLCRAGCQELQGYIFGRPQPENVAKNIISDTSNSILYEIKKQEYALSVGRYFS